MQKNPSESISTHYQIIFPLQYIDHFWKCSFFGLDKFITFFIVYQKNEGTSGDGTSGGPPVLVICYKQTK
jgi:hypothetical protein